MKVRIEPKEYAVKDVCVGKAKESMDIVGDYDLLVSDVTAALGCYYKYHVKGKSPSPPPQATNAFKIMMAAQRMLDVSTSQVRHPPAVIVQNKHEELFNDVLSAIESKGL